MKTASERRTKVKFPVDTLLLFSFSGDNKPAGKWDAIDIKLQQKFNAAAKAEGYTGKEKETFSFLPADGKPAARIVVAGLGERKRFDGERLRRSAGFAVPRLKAAKSIDVLLPMEQRLAVESGDQAQAVLEGLVLALYRFDRYKSNASDNGRATESVRVIAETDRQRDEIRAGLERGEIYSRATMLARDLVNEPPSSGNPRWLAAQASGTAKKGLTVKVYDEKKIKQMKMGAVQGVAIGSTEPARFVHMTWKVPGAKKTIAIVGKGITFDSGGLCLKSADGMLNMKGDMGGAAAVVGIMSALPALKPKVNVHGIFAATENMPGGAAYKTRDVLTARNGKTIEIINTDAEGRLILADALSYASDLDPDEIIDLATLTGAVVVALGNDISGIFSNDQDLAGRISAAGHRAGEKVWQLPLEEDYMEMIRSDVADMKNSGGRWGGAILAALLLREFVADGISWAHIDIAGPALRDSQSGYRSAGGTGFIVRTMLRYLQDLQA